MAGMIQQGLRVLHPEGCKDTSPKANGPQARNKAKTLFREGRRSIGRFF